MALLPLAQLDHDLVADRRHRAHPGFGRIGHVDVVDESRVVGDDVEKEFRALEIAAERLVLAREDADDAAGRLAAGAVAVWAGELVAEPHDDLVAMHGHAGVLGGDLDGGLLGPGGALFREDIGRAALAELDATGDEVGVARQAEPVLLDADDLASGEEAADLEGERVALLVGKSERAGDPGFIERDVVGGAEQGRQAFAKLHGGIEHIFKPPVRARHVLPGVLLTGRRLTSRVAMTV